MATRGEAADGTHHRSRARDVGRPGPTAWRAARWLRLRDERGAMLALRLRPGQVRTLANGLGGIVEATQD